MNGQAFLDHIYSEGSTVFSDTAITAIPRRQTDNDRFFIALLVLQPQAIKAKKRKNFI